MPLLRRENAHRRVQGLATMEVSRLLCGTPIFGSSWVYLAIVLLCNRTIGFVPVWTTGLATRCWHNSGGIWASGNARCAVGSNFASAARALSPAAVEARWVCDAAPRWACRF